MFEAPEGIWGKTVPGMLPASISLTEKGTGDPLEGAEIRIFEKTADGYFDNRSELYEGVLSPQKKGCGHIYLYNGSKSSQCIWSCGWSIR